MQRAYPPPLARRTLNLLLPALPATLMKQAIRQQELLPTDCLSICFLSVKLRIKPDYYSGYSLGFSLKSNVLSSQFGLETTSESGSKTLSVERGLGITV